MNNKIAIFASFITGAVVGSAASIFILRKKYENIAQEEIDSVKKIFTIPKKEYYAVPPAKEGDADFFEYEEQEDDISKVDLTNKPDINEYTKTIKKEWYKDYSNYSKKPEDEKNDIDAKENDLIEQNVFDHNEPYVITPEQAGDEYDIISLTYFSDGILADEDNEIVDNIQGTVGFDSLTRFGEFEDDSVYVRNDRLKADYEILEDVREYSEAIKDTPLGKEIE